MKSRTGHGSISIAGGEVIVMKRRRLRAVLLIALLVAVPSVGAERYEALFDTWWLPLVHDWTQQLHEPEGAEFRRVQVLDDRNAYWHVGRNDSTDIFMRDPETESALSVRWGSESIWELRDNGAQIFRYDPIDGFPLAIYYRQAETDDRSKDLLEGEWSYHNREPRWLVRVDATTPLDVFILHEEVPIVDIPRGTYIIERVSAGVMKAETFGLLEPFYILFDPTDDERLWLTTAEEGPDIEPWVDYRGLDVAYLHRLDESRIEGR